MIPIANSLTLWGPPWTSVSLGTLRPGHFLPGHRLLGRLGTARKHAMRRILWLLPADPVVRRDAWYAPVCASEGSGLEGGACRGPWGTERGRRGRGECCLPSLTLLFLSALTPCHGSRPRSARPTGPSPGGTRALTRQPLGGGGEKMLFFVCLGVGGSGRSPKC